MKLKQLPPKIRLLAMQRISEQGKYPNPEMTLASLFTFADTPEGHAYWKEVHFGNMIMPGEYKKPKPKGAKVIIKLKNDLWNGLIAQPG